MAACPPRLRRAGPGPGRGARARDPRCLDASGEVGHAFAHAWANDSATEVAIEVAPLSGAHVEVTALVAEPGPLVAMKLQAIMKRPTGKQGTDLQDIARLILDEHVRPAALAVDS